jgi:hypothetical protein
MRTREPLLPGGGGGFFHHPRLSQKPFSCMLEFEPNTVAFMTAALEQCCKKLKNDTPEARRFIADKLTECAKRGRASQIALTSAAEAALAELNGRASGRQTRKWRALVNWFT